MRQNNGIRTGLTAEEQIALRAYEKWKQRGSPAGDSESDWFAARAELEAERERQAYEEEIAVYE